MPIDIISMGEMLIDFVPLNKGLSLKENDAFLRMPGGAPANVAVGIAKLGVKSAFCGKLGKDSFGNFLITVLEDNDVNINGIVQTDKAKTTLAFVTLSDDGDRNFTFYRDPGADMLYKWEEVNLDLFQHASIFHHGSISLINEPVRTTTLKMIRLAKDKGLLVSYDPNLRMFLWPDENEARKWIVEGMKTADIVKISEEELEFITGTDNLSRGVEQLFVYGVQIVFVTLGARGCYYNNGQLEGKVTGFQVGVQDTTGAGDAFVSGVLSRFVKDNIICIDRLTGNELEEIVEFANAVGALTTSGKGAISSMPDLKAVEELIINKEK